MKAVILAGGQGSRLSEETVSRPKPMVEIGGKPILWHIMKIYSAHGIQDFVICAGYRGYMIKEYFANYFMHTSDVTFRINENRMEVHHKTTEPWTITVVDTGETVMTGGRIARIKKYVEGETFCLTYGDGLADIPIPKLLAFHHEHGKEVTLTAVQSPGRFGALAICDSKVESFLEKPKGDGAWINGGGCVSPSWILATHGYLARQDPPRRSLGKKFSPMEDLVDVFCCPDSHWIRPMK